MNAEWIQIFLYMRKIYRKAEINRQTRCRAQEWPKGCPSERANIYFGKKLRAAIESKEAASSCFGKKDISLGKFFIKENNLKNQNEC